MNDATQIEPCRNEPEPAGTTGSFGMADIASVADLFRAAESPAIALVGFLILIPLAALTLLCAAWPLFSRAASALDYRRALTGARW